MFLKSKFDFIFPAGLFSAVDSMFCHMFCPMFSRARILYSFLWFELMATNRQTIEIRGNRVVLFFVI